MDEQNKMQSTDVDIKPPTGIGMKILVLVAIVLAISGGVAAGYFLLYMPQQQRQAELERHQNFYNEFTKIHTDGFAATWKCIFGGTELTQVNTNLKLEQLIESALSQNEATFGKLVLACVSADEEVLAALEKEPQAGMTGLPGQVEALGELEVEPEYEEAFAGLPETLDAMNESWVFLGEYFEEADKRAQWDKKLTDSANKGWGTLWAKDQKREKFTASDLSHAWRYYKFMTCSLGVEGYEDLGEFKKTTELEALIGKIAIDEACSTEEKADAQFGVINDCAEKYLLASKTELDAERFATAIKKGYYNEQRSLAAIAGSFEGEQGIIYEGCISKARSYRKATGIANLFKAMMAYSQARAQVIEQYKKEKEKLEEE